MSTWLAERQVRLPPSTEAEKKVPMLFVLNPKVLLDCLRFNLNIPIGSIRLPNALKSLVPRVRDAIHEQRSDWVLVMFWFANLSVQLALLPSNSGFTKCKLSKTVRQIFVTQPIISPARRPNADIWQAVRRRTNRHYWR